MTDDVNRTDGDLGPEEARWYVIHTYSGHENKVKNNMESMVKNQDLGDLIFDVQVPMEDYVEEKDGVKKLKERKMFPSYVLVKMIMNDKSWYVVRNTRGVTGFVGPGSKPIPLSDEEVKNLGVSKVQDDTGAYAVGDRVKVLTGPFEDFIGVVESVDAKKQKVTVSISMFGRDTLVELDENQLVKD
ncbi:MAG: transcription termination/antitermination protein NusG [Peptoniphilus sp.]|nr:transcription termination/antitermination protein NusG [Peptoniphilus sp.]MDD7363589.1 transcription termination/antitermination protein NusG [Bacillota bacterium]MDY6045220.1 transcription termination/antitermination protein NusG [Peptoniphilus sp.]